MLLARMSQHENRNRRCHLVDELKNIPQNKNTKQTNENLKDWKENQKRKKTESNKQTQRRPGYFLLTDDARTNQEDLRI